MKLTLPSLVFINFALSTCSYALNVNTAPNQVLINRLNKLELKTKNLQNEVTLLKKQKHTKQKNQSPSLNHSNLSTREKLKPWPHFVTVTTTPFIGKHLNYDGSDLLYNVTTINEDRHLLNQKKKLQNEMAAQGYALDRPILQISGGVEGEVSSVGAFSGPDSKNISLGTAELQFNAIASSWASGFMSLDFSGSPTSTGNREPISTIYLGRGFVTIGNFNVAPVYFTAGLMYVPFGRYASGMTSSVMASSMAKIRTPALLLGLSLPNGLFGSVYAFTGNKTSTPNDLIRQEGVNIGYNHSLGSTDNINIGAGWVSNIADSQGMQGTGISTTGQFAGFGSGTGNNNLLVHSVDAIDMHASISLGPLSFLGEYLTAIRQFSPLDLTYNSRGATPAALHTEIDYMLPFFAKKYDTAIGISYGRTWEALGLNLAKDKYAIFLNTNIWRETTQSIEYNVQENYASSTTATGRGGPTAITGNGKVSHSFLAELGVYL